MWAYFISGKPTSEIGTPIKQQPNISSPLSRAVFGGPKVVPNVTALPGGHNKISFPILTPLQKKQLLQQQQIQKDDGKHIVLQIKHGNSTTMEKSPDGKSKVVNGAVGNQKAVGLVPYNDDSDSEQENAGKQAAAENCVSVKNQQETATACSSLQAAGDYHNKQASVQKLTLPAATSGDSKHLICTNPAPGHKSPIQSQRDLQTSSSDHHQPSTSDSKNQLTSLQAKLPSAHMPPHASSKNIRHREIAPSSSASSKPVDAPPDLSALSSSTSTPMAAGKGGVMELPVVNMSSYAESSSARLKAAGGNWLVQAQDCAPSPRGSCSSSNSVNSSTEWTVQSKGNFIPSLDLSRRFSKTNFCLSFNK